MKVFVYDKKHSRQVAVFNEVLSVFYDSQQKVTLVTCKNGTCSTWIKKDYKLTVYSN